MIRLGYGDGTAEQIRPVLAEKEVIKDRFYAPKTRTPEIGAGHYFEERAGYGYRAYL
jgi:hypothetical protein